LGSSNYITDLNGNISQHMEYLPFGETLVEEHKNSNNSPYKFNGKELDDETGNYYYGARYLNPKFSIWLSVDPLAEKYPGWSPYNYTLQNPVKLIDPDGRSVEESAGGCPWPCPPDNTAVRKHEVKRYTERSTSELIDNIGNISIDGFMKDGQGMETRSWKRGQRVSHISYEELSNIGDKAAPSRFVRGLQSTSKFSEVYNEILDNIDNTPKNIKVPQISLKNNNDPQKQYIVTKYMTYPSNAKKHQIDTVEGTIGGVQNYRDRINKINKPSLFSAEVNVDSTKIREIK